MTKRKYKQIQVAKILNPAAIKAAIDKLPRHELSLYSSDLLMDNYVYMLIPDVEEYGPSVSETAEQLKRVETGARALFKSLAELQGLGGAALRSSLKSVEGPPVWSGGPLLHTTVPDLTGAQLEALLHRLAEAAETAQKNLPADRRGPVPLARAWRVADQAAEDFYRLTRKAPTRISIIRTPIDGLQGMKTVGPFIIFLQEIFDALGIEASADRVGQRAIRTWRARNPGLVSVAAADKMPGQTRGKLQDRTKKRNARHRFAAPMDK